MVSRLPFIMLMLCTASQADEDPWNDEAIELARAVNEGDLIFLAEPTQRPVHHHINRIHLTNQSLDDGWVELHQCHENLDPVAASQIVFDPRRIRALRIINHSGIGDAYVQDASVQLQNVETGASLCLAAESQALHQQPDGCRQLRNGPYMRRFLDGYYPMRVSLQVSFPETLEIRNVDPASQPGVQRHQQPGWLSLSMQFEGRLHTQIRFCRQTD